MEKIILKATNREQTGTGLNKKRAEGMVPAVVYGQGMKNKNLWLNVLELERVYKKAGENTIIELSLEGDKSESVLLYDFQEDIISGKFIHVDFLKIDMKKEIETEVPIKFFGESPAVKERGGTLIVGVSNIAVKCLPGNIPSEFKINLSALATFDDHIKKDSLDIPAGVEALIDEETIIASVTPPRSEEDMAKLDEKVEEDVSQVEGAKEDDTEGEGKGESGKDKDDKDKSKGDEKPTEDKDEKE